MDLDISFLEKTNEQINDCSEQQEEAYALSSKNKPINERTKGLYYEELESMANNIEIIFETIETNNIISRVKNQFEINGKEPEEEVNKSNRFL